MRRHLIVFVLAACGAKPGPTIVPLLPGDGDANTAKPVPVKHAADDAWSGKELITPPAPKPPTAVELPAIEDYKLANGLQVYVIKSNKLPTVSMQLAIRAGRMAEPRARLGVGELTADMLVKGTRRRDATALAKAIDFVGGTIAADATFEATLVSCSVLSRNANTCLELLPEIIIQPSFPEAELVKTRDRLIAQIRQRFDDAGQLASAHVQNLLWSNDHVRGWINSEAAVQALRRDDLVAWHKTWFVPGNSMLVVSGDVDSKKLKSDLERAFGGWAKGPTPPTPQYPEPGLSGIRIRLVDKPGQTQTHIRVAQFGIRHEDARFFDTLVWNYVLGGGAFNSRLMKVVRVAGGKTYGASSSFDRNVDRGSFVATTFTRNAETVATTLPIGRGRRRRARRRRAPQLRHRVPDELSTRDRQGRCRVGEARRAAHPRSEELRDRDGRRREGHRAPAQEGRLALREGLVQRPDHAGDQGDRHADRREVRRRRQEARR